ncbi:helix-turn-helix domain-containing protein [Streptomyces tirandamycinicus]|uniref:helix-turn-helix domain-containing protein n=1 Tax=Streptomyces tirandamycinicus TaxID=2174846 RepID=UPI00226EC359|nr:pyridoxamine 5'-phosphate oxidase family protein [Streptomyces tirandamycinicus]MCY0982734.1 pyridoxamine 5'-phosphate oxidase family protein [Streptomyces tirandamycinicus]
MMPSTSAHGSGAGTSSHSRTDLGRRLAARREQLGLRRDDVAERSGAATSYIQYLEERPAAPDAATLRHIAAALETTVADLAGGTADQPPGPGAALRGAELAKLDEAECRTLMSGHGVGRIGLLTPEGPAVVPVNYVVDGASVAFRTALGKVPSFAAGSEVAFEVDRIDDVFSRGWSVLAVGRARAVTDEESIRRLTALAPTAPWAGGSRDLWVELSPTRVTGRRIVAPDS